jgi:DNA-binding transcriptional ArsR family regulator
MKEGPDIAQLGALVGDPARANMLIALMSGAALTASELAAEAGVTVQTASTHLKKLETADLLVQRKQGRHRYFTLADDDVGALLETMMGLAARRGLIRSKPGPKDPALRKARVCYNHLAGELGVALYDGLIQSGAIEERDGEPVLTAQGRARLTGFGIDLAALENQRRPLCRSCLDWSARRSHLAGSLGQSLMTRFEALGWARRQSGSRVVTFTEAGEQALLTAFAPAHMSRQPGIGVS